MELNSLFKLVKDLTELVMPLALQAEEESGEDLLEFFLELGFELPSIPAVFNDIREASVLLVEAHNDLEEKILELEAGAATATDVATTLPMLAGAAANYFLLIHSLPGEFSSQLPAAYRTASGIENQFIPRFYDYCISVYTEERVPPVYGFLYFLGILEESFVEATADNPEFALVKVNWGRIKYIFTDLNRLFRETYGWDTPEIDVDKLYEGIQVLTTALSIPAEILQAPIDLINNLAPEYAGDEDEIEPQLLIPVLDFGILNLFILFQVLPNDNPAVKQKLALSLLSTITLEETFPLVSNLYLELFSSISIDSGISVVLSPADGFSVMTDAFSSGGAPLPSGEVILKLAYRKEDGGAQIRILTINEQTYLELKELYVKAGVTFMPAQEAYDFLIELGLLEGKFIQKNEDSDGFLNQVLPSNAIEANLNLIIGWSSRDGLYIKGSAGLEIHLPVHIDLGIIVIEGLFLGAEIDFETLTLPLEISGILKANLGPLKAVVERMGVRADLQLVGEGGGLGPADFDIGFKPPNGVGLSLDVGVVKGGGYLYFDFDREEYAGALELVFSEWIALKAIGLITTKMPDGSKGFSMVIIITAEFGEGIQLGFGFTLLGVGGILGLNRVVNVDPMLAGVKTGAIESVLFPQDVVANAPRIISDLRQFFPVQEGQFLIGPMAKIGYGTPTLASLSLGVIIEFPDVAITILGVLKVVLPDENAEVLKLQVNFLGRIEPANSLLWFYAELYDSRILLITIEGGMGLLVNWGDDANFVFTVGGFHPQYDPPPLPFPTPPRLALNILNEPAARIRVEGYFAVTSNSVQFGARAELFFGFSALKVEGFLGFDVLFQFNPFYFILEFAAGLSVKVFGFGLFSISISGLLEGPSKWHIKGKAKWKITWLGPTIKINIEETWGEEKQTTLPPIPIFPIVEREFDTLNNWRAIVPESSNLMVSLRKLDEADAGSGGDTESNNQTLVLHPVGMIRANQTRYPVNFTGEKLGQQAVADVNRFTLSASIAGGSTLSTAFVKDKFATGEYIKLDKSKKLSSPGFELYDSGIDIKTEGDQLKTSMAVKRILRYETIIIDNNFKREAIHFFQDLATRFVGLIGTLFVHFLQGSIITQSTLSASYRSKLQPNPTKVVTQPPGYSVANIRDNTQYDAGDGVSTTFVSQAQAEDFLQQQLAANPNLASKVHIIPNPEVHQLAAA